MTPGTLITGPDGMIHTVIGVNGTGHIVSVTNPGRHCDIHVGVIGDNATPPPPRRRAERKPSGIVCRECGAPQRARGWCGMHYKQWERRRQAVPA